MNCAFKLIIPLIEYKNFLTYVLNLNRIYLLTFCLTIITKITFTNYKLKKNESISYRIIILMTIKLKILILKALLDEINLTIRISSQV